MSSKETQKRITDLKSKTKVLHESEQAIAKKLHQQTETSIKQVTNCLSIFPHAAMRQTCILNLSCTRCMDQCMFKCAQRLWIKFTFHPLNLLHCIWIAQALRFQKMKKCAPLLFFFMDCRYGYFLRNSS